MTALPEPRSRSESPDAIRRERLLVGAAVLTSFFGEFVKFLLAIWVYSVTQSVTAFAALFMVAYLPNILLAPKVGVWLDQTNKVLALRRAAATLLVAATAGALGLSLALPSLVLALLVTLPIAIADAIEAPAYGAAAAQLVPKSRLHGFNGVTESARSFSIMIAPILAGLVIAAIDPVRIMVGAAAIAAVAWLLLLGVPAAGPATSDVSRSARPDKETLTEFRKTLAFIFADSDLSRLMIASAALNGLMAAYVVLFYPMVLQQFAEKDVGVIRAGFALGMVAGGLVVQLPILRRSGVRLVIGGAALTALLLFAITLGPPLYGVLVLQAAVGATLTAMQAKGQTLWQQITPEAVLGRVFATRRMIAFAVVPLMYAATPLLVQLSMAALAGIAPLAAVVDGAAAAERLTVGLCALCCLAGLLRLLAGAAPSLPRPADRPYP